MSENFDLIAKSERWVSGNKSTMDACRQHLIFSRERQQQWNIEKEPFKNPFYQRCSLCWLNTFSIQSVFKSSGVWAPWCCRERLLTARGDHRYYNFIQTHTIFLQPVLLQFYIFFLAVSPGRTTPRRREELKMKCDRAFYDTCYKFRANQFIPRCFLLEIFCARVERNHKIHSNCLHPLHFFFYKRLFRNGRRWIICNASKCFSEICFCWRFSLLLSLSWIGVCVPPSGEILSKDARLNLMRPRSTSGLFMFPYSRTKLSVSSLTTRKNIE